MFREENGKLVMQSGDFGVPIPFAVRGEGLLDSDLLIFSLFRHDREVIRKTYPADGLIDRAFLLRFNREEAGLLAAGSYLWTVRLVRGEEPGPPLECTLKGPCILEVR